MADTRKRDKVASIMLLTDCLRRAAQELDSDSDVIVVPDPSKQGC